MELIHKSMHEQSAYQFLGAGAVQQTVLQETLEGTYFTFSGQEFVRTRRGTRPGDSLADIVFKLVFARVLAEIKQVLQQHELLLELPQKVNRNHLAPSASWIPNPLCTRFGMDNIV